MLREVEVAKLSVGMYVAELDRPWLETPFTLQGFYVRSTDDIRRIADFCHAVMVDPRRYDSRLAGFAPRSSDHNAGGRQRPKAASSNAGPVGAESEAPQPYQDAADLEEEFPAARDALNASAATFREFWRELTERRKVSINNLRAAVDPLVDSILRNKDALVTLMRVQHLDRNTHEHCMALAVWGSLLGRQLGLPPAEIKLLALGCSLLDIGKVRLPKQMLYKPGPLTATEYAIVQSHVDYSLKMLTDMGDSEDAVVDTVRWHHERMDGSGYPDGLEGGAIPMFARIGGIVDSYDAMISPRSYASTCSSYEALVELQDHCPRHFQIELVDQFAQAIGLFPNGALVELSTGEVGVVCGQNPGRRLRPKIMLILDADKRKRDDLVIVDLKLLDEHDMRVSRELARNEYGIDAQEYFL
jgi:HD-GYP domain-containing protein (c-di-GMP phosphodiesterase class II)